MAEISEINIVNVVLSVRYVGGGEGDDGVTYGVVETFWGGRSSV